MTTRISLDPILTAQIIYEGAVRMQDYRDEQPSLREVIWFLVEEAVKVDRSIAKPGPARNTTMNMEHFHTSAEIVGAYNQILEEIRDAEAEERAPQPYFKEEEKPRPDAMAHRRYLEVMGWLRVIRAKRRVGWKRRAALVMALAGGMGGRRALEVFDEERFPNVRAVYGARDRALSDIEGAVKQACKGLSLAA